MTTDRRDRSARGAFRVLVSSALALVFAAAGLPAQEGQVTAEEIERALTHPDELIEQIESQQSMKAVTVVSLETIYPDRQQADRVTQQHGEAVEKFREQAREHETVTRALEDEGVSPDDVVAIHVGSPMDAEQEGDHEGAERREMAVHRIMYVVVSGPEQGDPDEHDGDRPQPDEERSSPSG